MTDKGSKDPVRLADAAEEALSGLDEFAHVDDQVPLVPAFYTKFVGMSYESLDALPDLRAEMTFTVKGTVVGHSQELRADNEVRDVVKVKVEHVVQVKPDAE